MTLTSNIRFRLSPGLLLLAAACGDPADRGPEPATLIVAAAAGLAEAMPALTAAFTEESGIDVSVTLGSTGQLAQQVRAGAPIDVLLAADRNWIETLHGAGLLQAQPREVFASGTLVLFSRDPEVVRAGLPGLRSTAVRSLAIANPRAAPYGRAARQILEALDLWGSLQPKLVLAENARQTVQWAETGNVDAALVPLSLMRQGNGSWTPVPADLHAPLDQIAAVVTGSSHPREAAAFVTFLTSPRAQAVLMAHGLAP